MTNTTAPAVQRWSRISTVHLGGRARTQVILSALAVAVFMELAPSTAATHCQWGSRAQRIHVHRDALPGHVAVALVHGGLAGPERLPSSVSEAANQRLRMQIDPNVIGASANQSESGEKASRFRS